MSVRRLTSRLRRLFCRCPSTEHGLRCEWSYGHPGKHGQGMVQWD